MFNWLIAAALAVGAGVSIIIQQGLNVQVRGGLNSAAWAGVVSYAVGLVSMLALVIILRDPVPTVAMAGRLPLWAWSGGLFGAIYIGLAIFLVPQLGANTFVVLLVAGQMMTSIVIDHFGLFGLVQRTIDLPRLVGVVFLIAGVMLVKR